MKTKTQHTPGPWKYEVTNDGNIGSKDKVRVEASDGHIAIACRSKRIERNTFGPVSVPRGLPEVKANAILIAAAPELLEAAKIIQGRYDSGESLTESLLPYLASGRLRGAIAKAEGR